MAQMTHARIYFPESGKYAKKEITAKEYAKKREEMRAREDAGEIECHCPDPHCDGVRVQFRGEHMHTYYGRAADGTTPQPYRLEIEDFFQRMPGAKEHHPDCNIVKEYGAYRGLVVSLSELRTGHQSFRLNLNIPSHDLAPPHRKPPTKVDDAFRRAAQGKRIDTDRPRRPPLSHSLSSIHGLGSLIERAAYDDGLQRNTIIHVNGRVFSLKDFYSETPAELFERGRTALADAKRLVRGAPVAQAFFPAATVFRPVLPNKFWAIGKEGPGEIYGQASKVRGRDGVIYNVCTVLHVANRDLFFDLKAQFHKGYESFLVVSEKNTIDLDEIRARNVDVRTSKINTAFHIHTYVNVPAQITPWTPPPEIKEMDLGESAFDLREPPQPKPGRASSGAKRSRGGSGSGDAQPDLF